MKAHYDLIDSDLHRKKTRFLSSLLDLKLEHGQSKIQQNDEDGKRKCMKFCFLTTTPNQSQILENFTIVEKKKSFVDKNLMIKSLASHFIFSSLIKDKTILDHLLQKFKLCRVNKDEYLMRQNDSASSFFILHEGQLAVQIDGKTKKVLQSGDGFGELALLYSSPRSASIKANKASFLWFIDRLTFRSAISSLIEKNFNETRKFIDETQFFNYLTNSQKDKIASISIIHKFHKGQVICKEGEMASSMYIIKIGELTKLFHHTTQTIKKGALFGEYTMLEKNCKWKQTVTAETDSQLIALSTDDVEKALGRSLPLIIIRNKAKQCLRKSKQFLCLNLHYQNAVLDCFKIKNVNSGEKIVFPSMICLVLQGEYCVTGTDGKSMEGDSSYRQIYGSMTEKSNIWKEMVFQSNGKIAWTTAKQIISFFKCSYEVAVQKSLVIEKTQIKHRDYIAQLRGQCSKYSVNDFKVLTKLGEGQFGTVFLVTNPSKTKFFALKCISKSQTMKFKLEKHIINEKLVMQEMNYYTPFCVSFIRSFKDDNYIYFLMEYINGLQLFDTIRLIGLLNSEQCRFYGAIMVQFLEKIHSKNIIYRDLKPENVMVTENGYLKLIDMGTCKKLQKDNKNNGFLQKTFTIIGTPNYMAPEIISGKGYSCSVDLWSLGVVMYQFIAGSVPFGEDAQDPYEIYQQILRKQLLFPTFIKDQSIISFITQLLSKMPEARIGGSYSSLKRHPFLASVDWSGLLQKKVPPAFIIPKEKLVQIEKHLPKAKSLSSQLPSGKGGKKQLTPWDSCF